MLPHRRKSWHRWAIALGVLFLLGALGGSYSEDGISFVSKISFIGPSVSAAGSRADSKRQPHFLPNSFRFWDKTRNFPTEDGPAYADIVLEPQNFLPCRGGPFALCFYSGPDTGDPDLSCTVDEDGQFASCNCFEIPYGTYFVLIHGILNYEMYRKTVRECGEDGSDCFLRINKAPVCDAINNDKFMPNAEFVSTFSLNCAFEEPIGQTDCTTEDPFLPYAGCMTASCIGTEVEGIVRLLMPDLPRPISGGAKQPGVRSRARLGMVRCLQSRCRKWRGDVPPSPFFFALHSRYSGNFWGMSAGDGRRYPRDTRGCELPDGM